MSRTLDRVGSREVHVRMSLAVTGREVSMLSECDLTWRCFFLGYVWQEKSTEHISIGMF